MILKKSLLLPILEIQADYASPSHVINLITLFLQTFAQIFLHKHVIDMPCNFMSKTPEHVLLQSHSISSPHSVPVLLFAKVSSDSWLVRRGAQSARSDLSARNDNPMAKMLKNHRSTHLRLHKQRYPKVHCVPAHHIVLI